MSDHITKPLSEFADEILADGIIDAAEVAKIRERIYDDGIIDRDEADFLFQLNDGVSGKENDAGWKDLFVEALTDYVLKDDVSPDVLDADEAGYLIKKIEGDGVVDDVELALIINITAKAKECTPEFNAFVLDALKKAVIADGIVDAAEVEMMKRVIYGTGSGDGEGVDRAEAEFLFEINDATTNNEGHDPSWKDLFVEAIAKHVLEDDVSPGELDEGESEWLISKIEGDGVVDNQELELIINITAKATKCTPGFNAFVLNALKKAVIADGIVDAAEVEMMKKVIYGTGSGDGEGVDRAEAEFLFEINDATTDNEGHDPSWKDLFVEAIAKHVLEDDESPGEIDAAESEWLISKIEGDGQYDDNEKALLAYIKENAKTIDGKLKFKMEMHNI